MENTVVNSREQKLRGTDIITISVSDMTPPEMQAKVMAMIAKETTIPNTDMVQFGNTVFITHIKEDFTYETRIAVYGFSVPRIRTEYFCPVTRETILVDLPQNHQLETYLTAEAEAEGEELIFCTQRK